MEYPTAREIIQDLSECYSTKILPDTEMRDAISRWQTNRLNDYKIAVNNDNLTLASKIDKELGRVRSAIKEGVNRFLVSLGA